MNAQPPWVLGLDTALRRSGAAAITHQDGTCTAQTWVLATSPQGTGIAATVATIENVARQLTQLIDVRMGYPPVLALIEGPSYGSTGGAHDERAGLRWSLARLLVRRGVPVGTCTPATRAKWATDRGNADKAAVVAAMRELWPRLAATQNAARHNEVDGLVLAHAAAQHLGWPVPVRKHHGGPLAVIKWPEVG